jgi:hypothetical protein
MPDILRIKRRLVGGLGTVPPSGLYNAELAYNENDDTLWYGRGLGGGNLAVAPIVVGGAGMGSSAAPTMNSGATGVAGSAGNWARGDHVHPSDTSRAPTASPTFTGTTTINGTVQGTAMVAWHAAPGPIGSTTPSTGAFTTLSVTGTLSGTGFNSLFAAPPVGIGSTTPSSGAFTTLSASGAVTGAGISGVFAAPPVGIGSTTPSTGAFTGISASGAVTGTGFNNLFAAPPAGIGSTTPTTGAFTTLSVSSTISGAAFNALFASPPVGIGSTAPSTGAFTNLAASGAVSGTGFVNWAASPPAIGGTAANAGTFSNLNVTGTLFGTGVTTVLTPYAKIDSQTFTGNPVLPVTAALASTPTNATNSTVIATTAYVRQTRLDQFVAPTADVAMGSRKITGLADPTVSTDAATRNYVDLAIQGINAKQAVRVATVANLASLSGLLTVDGVTLLNNDRILVKDQTTATQNGVYVASSIAWSRATDFDLWAEFLSAFVFVEEGTTNANNGYLCTATAGGAVGTTPITWVQFSGAGQINAGAGLTKSGNTLNVGAATGITVGTDTVGIDPLWGGQNSISVVGTILSGTWGASTIDLSHGGTGVTSLPTGYVQSNGTILSTVTQIPNTAIAGLKTMAFQDANAVAITGGTIGGSPGVTWDLGTF